MSEKTKEIQDTMYTQSLSTFNDQNMRIGWVGELGHLFGFHRRCLLNNRMSYLANKCHLLIHLFVN